MVKWTLLGSSALRSAAVAALAATSISPAFAQDTPTTSAETAQTLPDTAAEDEEEVLVVTGSRIRQNETTSASPLQIIDPVLANRQGRFDTAEIIQNSPIASGSTQITSAVSINSVSNGGPGANTVSLRGLGAARTLVLLNSRRAGPAGTRGAVSAFDLNVLPSGVIKSVEVLKDGASSIYGSDAVAGVVNLLTKTSTNGIEINGFARAPIAGAGESYNLNVAWGTEFESGGHFLIAGDYYRENQLRRRDRDFLGCPEDYVFRPASTSGNSNTWRPGKERADTIDPRTGQYACANGTPWGHIWAYYIANQPDTDPDTTVTLIQYSYGNDNLGNYIPRLSGPSNPGDLIAPPGWYPVNYSNSPFTPAAYALTNNYHPFEAKSSVIPETERYTLYADTAYEIVDGIEVYAEGLFNRRRTYTDAYSQFYNFGYTGMYAPGDPEDPFPGWSSFPDTDPNTGDPVPTFAYISPTGILDQYDNTITVDYWRSVLGFRGEFAPNWRFDVYGQYSRSDGDYQLQQILKDAIGQQSERGYPYGACAGLFTPISNRPCVQINWVDPRVMAGALTDNEIGYLIDTETGHTRYTQLFVEGSVSGELWDAFGAGPIGIAVGGVVRRDSIDDQPGHITSAANPNYDPTRDRFNLSYVAPANCPDNDQNPNNLPPNCPGYERTTAPFVDNAFANPFSSGHTFGTTLTKEAFAEINVPLVKDVPWFQSLTFSGAVRITNVKSVKGLEEGFRVSPYETYSDENNGNITYKLMANWQVNDWVRFRATYGTSFRAPALFEQFLARQVSGARQATVDPCVRWGQQLAAGVIPQRVADNCAADGIPANHGGGGIQVTVLTSGGLGQLEPETSRSKTASIILTPRFAFMPDTRIALTVDYFDITVNDEIQLLNSGDIVFGCYNSDNFPNDPRCDLFERGQDGNPNNIKTITRRYINIDEQVNRGLDFTFRLDHDAGNLGKLGILAQATLQLKDTIDRQGEFDDLNGDVGDPKFTGQVNFTWELEDTTFFWGIDLIGKASSIADYRELNGSLCNITAEGQEIYSGNYCVKPYVPAILYHNVSITQSVADKFDFTLGVSNLFDKDPPRVSGLSVLGTVPLFASQYDYLGRRVFAAVKAKF